MGETVLGKLVVLLPADEAHETVEVSSNLKYGIVVEQYPWRVLVELSRWALQEGSHSLAQVLDLVGQRLHVEVN